MVRKRLIALVIGLSAGLALMELAASAWMRRSMAARARERGMELFAPSSNPALGFGLQKNFQRGVVTTNTLGFRERQWDRDTLAQRFVILNLGDSITFGSNTTNEQHVYGRALESLLEERGLPVVVYNAGVPGYNSEQQLALLDDLASTIEFDAVLVGFCLNDSSPMLRLEDPAAGVVTLAPQPIDRLADLASRRFLDRSSSFVLAKEAFKTVQRRFPDLFPGRMLWPNMLTRTESWSRMKSALLAMKQWTHRRGKAFVIVAFPYEHQLRTARASNLAQEDLAEFCRDHAIDFVDLYGPFRQRRGEIRFDAEGVHPDDAGHRVAAEVLARHLLERGLIVAPPVR